MNSKRKPAPSQKRWMATQIHECACGFGEVFLKLSADDPAYDSGLYEEDPCWYLEIIVVSRTCRDRLKTAWNILRGRDSSYCGLLLDKIDLEQITSWAKVTQLQEEAIQHD